MNDATITLMAQTLGREARLLDDGRFEDWFAMLDDDVAITVPIRQATTARADEMSSTGVRYDDRKPHIRARIDRAVQGHAFAEAPPSRTLRVVGSIEVEATQDASLVAVHSALLVYRQRGIDSHFDLVPCRRSDTWRIVDGVPKLVTRRITLIETTLATPNLGIFL